MTLPPNDEHPVKRVNYATEVNHDKIDRKEKVISKAILPGTQEGNAGSGGESRDSQGCHGVGSS
jgi:hypothetical protein